MNFHITVSFFPSWTVQTGDGGLNFAIILGDVKSFLHLAMFTGILFKSRDSSNGKIDLSLNYVNTQIFLIHFIVVPEPDSNAQLVIQNAQRLEQLVHTVSLTKKK